MTEAQDYRDALDDDEASRLLRQILSPAEAQSLVLPPPHHPPQCGPGESTPLTGNLAKPPSQATPSRAPDYEDVKPEKGTLVRGGLAGYFAAAPAAKAGAADRSGDRKYDRKYDPGYIKVSSKGQVGYLPKANLHAARQIDGNLKVLDEA
jgi:hypothetical protein